MVSTPLPIEPGPPVGIATFLDFQSALAGRFEFVRVLGEGGMATVLLARDLRHGRQVAFKLILPEYSEALGLQRFEREIQFIGRLRHPRILTVFESGAVLGRLWFTMPYIEGETLRARLRREHQLPLPEAIRIAAEVASALAEAHRAGIVHRDIKPENLLLGTDGAVYLTDFGIAKGEEQAPLTRVGITVGTPAYMSPEQASASTDLDGRGDLYALGCILYEMLAGEPPYSANTPHALTAKHQHADIPDIRILRRSVPERMYAVLQKSLAKSRVDRYPDLDTFGRELLRAGKPVPADRIRRHRAALTALIVAALVVAVGYSGQFRGPKPSRAPAGPLRILIAGPSASASDAAGLSLSRSVRDELVRQLSLHRVLSVVEAPDIHKSGGDPFLVHEVMRQYQAELAFSGDFYRLGSQLSLRGRLTDSSGVIPETVTFDAEAGDSARLIHGMTRQVMEVILRQIGVRLRARQRETESQAPAARDYLAQSDRFRELALGQSESARDTADVRAALESLDRSDSILVLAGHADPSWLRPMVERGWVAFDRAAIQGDEGNAALRAGLVSADTVLQRDPLNAEGLELRGTLRWQLLANFDSMSLVDGSDTLARRDLREAVARDSSRAEAWASLAFLLERESGSAGSKAAARLALEQAFSFRSLRRFYRELFFSYLQSGDYPEARQWCWQGRLDFPGDWRFVECDLTLLRADQSVAANPDSAWRLARQLTEMYPPEMASALNHPYETVYRRVAAAAVSARAGDRATGRRELDTALRWAAGDPHRSRDLMYDEIALRLALGDRKAAKDLYRQLRSNALLTTFVDRDPLFKALR